MFNLLEFLHDKLKLLSLEEQDFISKETESSVFPFNNYEIAFAHLLSKNILSLEEYYHVRNLHIKQNKHLSLFQISSPTEFGEKWAEGHLKQLVNSLIKPSKKNNSEYSGEYDFLTAEGIRVEVKASRAVKFKSKDPLYVKALFSNSPENFDMNFQQIKTNCCDVFVWIGVWRDKIRYWVLNSKEISTNKYFSDKQHRGNNGEGQLHLKKQNIKDFEIYESSAENLEQNIKKAFERQ